MPEYEAHFMELLRYAPHLNTEELKVNKFVSSLQIRRSMRKGCKLYAILALNEKGVAEV